MAEAKAWVLIPKLDKDKTGCVLDMRPLVLCKDCKHWDAKKNECNNINSYMQYRPCFGDWFCADGERKD